MQLTKCIASAIIGFAVLASAHPGEHKERNSLADLKKREFKANARCGLAVCADKMESRGLNPRAQARRQATVDKYSKRKMIRDTDSVLNTSHLSSENYTIATPENIIFSSNSTCILNPEGETGPVYPLLYTNVLTKLIQC